MELSNTYKTVSVAVSSSGANLIAPANPDNKIVLLAACLVPVAGVGIKFQSASTDLTGNMSLGTSSLFTLPYAEKGWISTNKGDPLNINLSGAVAVGGLIVYKEVP